MQLLSLHFPSDRTRHWQNNTFIFWKLLVRSSIHPATVSLRSEITRPNATSFL